ncbi:fibronectin type III domain-containing protein [Actomonas aquatica]|uniref:Fibronectin type III domain-containing protein n=1 Tax=Actomonas aquatica TaxID=2866162 RepID=A0ABZ1CBE5_9BACT|nr:fibronectin type III domain-containing protein [Opitutus sp. WL0086]WRQ89009.1 fibronectin type III domain-containing protein [Opitutus sp. WL0086]
MNTYSFFRPALLLAVTTSAALAHDEPGTHLDAVSWQPTAYAESAAHAPRPLPDRIVLTWTGDPSTSQTVTWRTDTSIERAVAELAIANDNGRALQPVRIAAETEEFVSNLGEAHQHHAEFVGLTPDTLYAYRVGDGLNWSEWFHFRTASRDAQPFKFVYFGDAQNDVKTHWSRVFRESFRDAPRAAFTLHAGDLINNANNDAQWGEWFGAPGWVNATVPVIAAPGNHEYYRYGAGPETDRLWDTANGETVAVSVQLEVLRDPAGAKVGTRVEATATDGRRAAVLLDAQGLITGMDAGFTALTGYNLATLRGVQPDKLPLRDRVAVQGERRISEHWRPQFSFPEQAVPAGLEETCYYIDYQGARIIALNSNEKQEEQVAWLEQVLSNNPQRWTIVTFHHPIFSPAKNRDNPKLRELWKPVFDAHKVDLVLTGHDHTYARTGDVSATVGIHNLPAGYNQAYDPAIGTVYVVSVSGPKMYEITQEAFVRSAEDTQLYQIISVDGQTLSFEARTATGRLYDRFELIKRDGQPNELREALPPLNRRPDER